MPEKRQSASAWPWESGNWRVAKAAKQKIDGSCGACREVEGGANTERRPRGASRASSLLHLLQRAYV